MKHLKYNKTKATKYVLGIKINSYFGNETLDDDISYIVCANLSDSLKAYQVSKKKENIADTSNIRKSRRLNPQPIDVNTLKEVVVSYGDEEVVIELEEEKVVEDQKTNKKYHCQQTVAFNHMKFKIPYNKLRPYKQKRRVNEMAREIIGACVQRKIGNPKDLDDFLIGNIDVAQQINLFIEMVKQQIQWIMKVNLASLPKLVLDSERNNSKNNKNT